MRRIELGTVIAGRPLIIRFKGKDLPVSVEIDVPQAEANGRDWYCPFRVRSHGYGRTHFSAGIDAFQALQLVTEMVEAHLFALNRMWSGGLCWPDGRPYFKLPDPDGTPPPPRRASGSRAGKAKKRTRKAAKRKAAKKR